MFVLVLNIFTQKDEAFTSWYWCTTQIQIVMRQRWAGGSLLIPGRSDLPNELQACQDEERHFFRTTKTTEK